MHHTSTAQLANRPRSGMIVSANGSEQGEKKKVKRIEK
jgi:hypothetical protein